MSGRWYKRCGADFIHGTMGLTLEEKGAYSLCLDLIYDRGGPIPDDARWLSGVCGVSIRKWNSLRENLIRAGKLYLSDGNLSNARADAEIVSAELSSRKLRESGAKGGRKRAENEARAKKNNDLGQATLKPKEEIREDIPLSKDKGASPQNSDKQFWDNSKSYLSSNGVNNPGGIIGKWVRDHGREATAQAITAAQTERAVDPVPYVQRCLAKKREVAVVGPDWGLC